VPTYNISSRFVWNNYDKIAWIRHKISATKQTVSEIKVFVVYMQSGTLLYAEKVLNGKLAMFK